MYRPITRTNPTEALYHRMSRWIRRYLQTGIRLDRDLLYQLETAFGYPDPETWLASRPCSEAESFLELLFFPDAAAQAAFEQTWGILRAPLPLEPAVMAELARTPIIANVSVADRRAPFAMEVPEFAVNGFVRRLRIDWQPPMVLEEALNGLGFDPPAVRARVMVRHTRNDWHPERSRLVGLLLERIPKTDVDFIPLLAFTLALLPELTPGADLFDFLTIKKQVYLEALRKFESFEKQRSAGNMEILMLQGARAAHGHPAHWQTQIDCVDRISVALFGHTLPFSPPATMKMECRMSTIKRL